ncbi:MAG: hypothetical protein ACLUKN_14425 [Bacilli bacterium]
MIFERDSSEDASHKHIYMGTACLLSFRKGEAAVLGMKILRTLLDADMDSISAGILRLRLGAYPR